MKNIIDLATELGIPNDCIIPYGWDKAKINLQLLTNKNFVPRQNSKLVLVTAITPTKAGEGKTTTTIGLHDALCSIGVKSLAVLREPSLGPVFGLKGGAVGALKSTVVPSDDINLHFTGDFHALTSTINLIAAIIENTIYQGNTLNINPDKIVWPRALDMNDRSLRNISVSSDGRLAEHDITANDLVNIDKRKVHSSKFVITVASELMAVFCIATDLNDLLDRAEKMIVAYTFEHKPVTVKDLHIRGAIHKLMAQAINPNLVQTLEENPVLIHGGPFANIAAGCNSIIATKLGLQLADVVVTEAGFGADLGGEKFLDIKCQRAGISPDCIVLVATVRALKLHGGIAFTDLSKENLSALEDGFPNLLRHARNMESFGVPVVIAINRFPDDTDAEIARIQELCRSLGFKHVQVNEAAIKGSTGGQLLAKEVMTVLETEPSNFKPLYRLSDTSLSIADKINLICKNIYKAEKVEYSVLAKQQLAMYEANGYRHFAICMAKTPSSFTDNPMILNAPINFTIFIREVNLSAGAEFIIPLTGDIMTMPGLPKVPLATRMED